MMTIAGCLHFRTVALLAAMLMTVGCTLSMGIVLPDGPIDLQDARIESLGQVSATSSKYGILSLPRFDQEMLDLAVNSALKTKGADLMLNMRITTELTNYIFPVYKIVLRVDGTAAKVIPQKPDFERSQSL